MFDDTAPAGTSAGIGAGAADTGSATTAVKLKLRVKSRSCRFDSVHFYSVQGCTVLCSWD